VAGLSGLDLVAQIERVLAGHLLPGRLTFGVVQAADPLLAPPQRVLGLHLSQGWLARRVPGHTRLPTIATRCGIRATPPCRSAGWPNGSPDAGRHSVTGTTVKCFS
jgi:hypothetical protein